MKKGYRTVVTAMFPLIWAILHTLGVDVPLEDQGAVVAGVTALMMIFWRTQTDTKIGQGHTTGGGI